MKKTTLLFISVFALSTMNAQSGKDDGETVVIPCSEFHITRPLTEIFAENPVDENKIYNKKESEDRDNRKPQKFRKTVEKDGQEYGNDPSSIQNTMGDVSPNRAPLTSWAGQAASGFRPMDPSGAVSATQYVQMINSTTFKVYNKSTGASVLTGTFGNLWSPATANDGDPIVMYDKAADRWFMSQFGQSGNKIYIAISQTNNAAGAYYTYTFTSPSFPDYLKFSVWQDGYYMTSNQSSQNVFCFERAKMLVGNAAARSIYKSFSPPKSGFFVPLPGDAADGVLPPAGTPCPIFSYSDNGWGGSFTDAINIYKMAVDWTPATPTATITSAGSLPTTAFDASYSNTWDDIPQPGTTQKLDGIGGVCMYRAQWKTWSGYNTVVLNWAVKISGSQRSIKWCELRQDQTSGTWSIYQQGIYTPDAATRWMGGIAMDNNGAIALAYMKSDATSIYPGLYYTGRRPCDPLGTLPVTESVAIAGSGSQPASASNRDGDYAQMVLDPDGLTFWHTSEYMGAGGVAKTQIFSFQLPLCANAAAVSILETTGPNPICSPQSVTFTATPTNGGTAPSYQWQVNGSNVGTNSPTYTTSTLTNGAVVTCILTSNLPGVTGNPATSNAITMVVGSTPATPAPSSNSPVCTGSTITLTTTAVSGATYAWVGPGTYTSAVQNPTRPTATNAMAGTYSLTVTVGGCTSLAGTTNVVVNPKPATPTATSNTPVCAGSTINLTAPTVASATYSWTGPSSFTSNLQNPTRPSATAAMAGSYSVTVTVNGCTSAIGTTPVVINPAPATPTITQTGAVFTSSSATGNQWYFNGVIIPGATGQSYTVTQNGSYTVVVTVSGCSATSAPKVISNVGIEQLSNLYNFTVFPNPSDGNFNVSFNVPSKGNYKLELINALGQLIYQEALTDFVGQYSKQLNIQEYGKGIYTISLMNSKNETVKKVVVY